MRLTDRELEPTAATNLILENGHCLDYLKYIPFSQKYGVFYEEYLVPKIHQAILLDTTTPYRAITYAENEAVLSLITVYKGNSISITIAISEHTEPDKERTVNNIEMGLESFLSLKNTHIAVHSLVLGLFNDYKFTLPLMTVELDLNSIYFTIKGNDEYEIQVHVQNTEVILDEEIRTADTGDRVPQ